MTQHTQPQRADICIVGAGAAGLFAGIMAARQAQGAFSVVALDSAKSLGAKILVAGGGRCNVTHFEVDETAFAGSSRAAIRKVLKRFDVEQTVAFFASCGVELKREETGKLFPVTDRARTVLNALLSVAEFAGVTLMHPARVTGIERCSNGEAGGSGNTGRFVVSYLRGETPHVIHARRVILATGGKALPKSGSDGFGLQLAAKLGHRLTPRIFPALVPLTLPEGSPLCALSGIAAPATLEVCTATGKRLTAMSGALLCTHFGISGPCALDVSRYYLDAIAEHGDAKLRVNWLPGETVESVDAALVADAARHGKTAVSRWLSQRLPARLAVMICREAGVDESLPLASLSRDLRRRLVEQLVRMVLPVKGHRGFVHAEVTAGGVPLAEVDLRTMESRCCDGLHLCGEICDVDGRIGGFNFQWAWSSGFVAGSSAAQLLLDDDA